MKKSVFLFIFVFICQLLSAQEIVTPQKYGAIGDGKHDDTDAIQQAINNATTIYIPSGTYKISSSIIIENSNMFYDKNGYQGKTIRGDAGTKLIIYENVPAVIIRGCHNILEDIVLTYSNDLYKSYSSSLLCIESLNKNKIKSSNNNVFRNIRCVSPVNVYAKGKKFGTGYHIISDSKNSTYQNRFESCSANDLQVGLCIENSSTEGINSNYYHIDLWNCDYLMKGNPGGSYFTGCYQAPAKLSKEDNVCIDLSGNNNTFDVFTYDVGTYDKKSIAAPFLNVTGINNIFPQAIDMKSVKGKTKQNKISATAVAAYNDPHIVYNSRTATTGEGGNNVISIAPYENSLRNSSIKSIQLETQNCTLESIPNGVYISENKQIPIEIKPLANATYNKVISLNCKKNATITIRFEMPNYSKLDGLYLYFSNRRLPIKSCTLRQYKKKFGSSDYIEDEYDFSTAAKAYLNCISLAPSFKNLDNYKFVELSIALNDTGELGLSYISAVIINEVFGPLLDDSNRQ